MVWHVERGFDVIVEFIKTGFISRDTKGIFFFYCGPKTRWRETMGKARLRGKEGYL